MYIYIYIGGAHLHLCWPAEEEARGGGEQLQPDRLRGLFAKRVHQGLQQVGRLGNKPNQHTVSMWSGSKWCGGKKATREWPFVGGGCRGLNAQRLNRLGRAGGGASPLE